MYAVVDLLGKQIVVEEGKTILVDRLSQEEGEEFSMENVLLISSNGSLKVGSPTVEGSSISAKILKHTKGDKVLVFKKKRRKGYRKMQGHRQQLSLVSITKIKS